MKVYYTLEFNNTTKTWVIFKNVESESGFSFTGVFENADKKVCKDRLENYYDNNSK